MIAAEHWDKPADRHTTDAGTFWRGCGAIWRLDSHHDCGFHLTWIGGAPRSEGRGTRICISERALGPTYEKLFDEDRDWVVQCAEGGSEGARAALAVAEGFPAARFYRRAGTYHVETGEI